MYTNRPRKPRAAHSQRGSRRHEDPTQLTQTTPRVATAAPQVATRKSQHTLDMETNSSEHKSDQSRLPLGVARHGSRSQPGIVPVGRSTAMMGTRPPVRSSTAPPQHLHDAMSRSSGPQPGEVNSDVSAARLRRKRSIIGMTTPTAVVEPQSRGVWSNSTDHMLKGNTSSVVHSPATPMPRDTTAIQDWSPRQQVHPALRCDSRLTTTPLSQTASIVSSNRYSISPAFSQVSSRTSVSSSSPNLNTDSFGGWDSGLPGPGLPSSPKALMNASRRESQSSSGKQVHPTVPPELAHLNVVKQATTSPNNRPQRPSREGTPDLSFFRIPVPVIESGLRLSHDQPHSPLSPSSINSRRHFFGTWSRSSSRESRHRKDSVISPDILEQGRGPHDRQLTSTPNIPLVHTNVLQSSSKPSSASRMQRLLGRSAGSNNKLQSQPRRGPVAGTGHEGYGKFGFRGRNFSLSSLRSHDRSNSVDSNTSQKSDRSKSYESEAEHYLPGSDTERSPPRNFTAHRGRASSDNSQLTNDEALVKSSLPVRKDLGQYSHRRHAQQDDPDGKAGRFINQCESTKHVSNDGWHEPVNKQVQASTRRSSITTSQENDTSASQPNPKNQSPRGQTFFQRAQATEDLTMARALAETSTGGPLTPVDQTSPEARQVIRYDRRHSSLLPSPSPSPGQLQAGERESPSAKPPSFRLHSTESPELLQATTARSVSRPSIVTPATHSQTSHPTQIPMLWNAFALGIHDRPARPQIDVSSEDQFIAFPSRQNTGLSQTSSSEATASDSNSTLTNSAHASSWLGDEDIWNEYNQLIDEVPMPKLSREAKTCKTTTSAQSPPFQFDDRRDASRPDSRFIPHIYASAEELEDHSGTKSHQASDDSDRTSRYLQPAATPGTPYSLSDIMAGYGERTASYASTRGRVSDWDKARTSVESGYSSSYSGLAGPSRLSSNIKVAETIKPIREESESSPVVDDMAKNKPRQTIDADLRFGALITTKWLSFGRVLFSPAHNEVQNGEDSRVLVVDGLGKDWSYYCALTYSNATFYNLEITTSNAQASTKGVELTNYHNIRHDSIGTSFPFPTGFFTAVIFRFPVATTDGAYYACMAECKRILRPGGFLEVAVVDVDMVSMGTIARKKLRGLKEDMYGCDSDISLRNQGDTMLGLVGRCGFENIKRCSVGIPVAGRLPRSQDTSSSSSSGRSSLLQSTRTVPSGHGAADYRRQTQDFAGILYSEPASSPTKARAENEAITKMVAGVGRWWYETCYGTVAAGLKGSMWEQPGLLRECERQGTTFKLLLYCAQKPVCPRRTASV